MKRFTINDAGTGTYVVKPAEGDVAAIAHTIDMEGVFGFSKLNDLAKRAVAFAVGHVSRNATAGKMEDVAEASKAVAERLKSLAAGKWSAGREGGEGESRTTLLAQALATVMACEPGDAAEYINEQIRAAWDAAKLPVEEDGTLDAESMTKEQLSTARKAAAKVRKEIGDDPAVKLEVAKLRAASAAKELEAANKASAEAKTPSKFAKQ